MLGARPVKADQVTLPAHVHLGYVTEEELTAEEKAQVIHAIPEAYQNEDTFYLVYKKKEATQSVLPQTGSQGSRSFWVKSSHSFLCGPSYFLKSTERRLWASF